jgi:hypothetical protein
MSYDCYTAHTRSEHTVDNLRGPPGGSAGEELPDAEKL